MIYVIEFVEMKFKLLRIFILSQLLIWCSVSILSAHEDSNVNDSTNRATTPPKICTVEDQNETNKDEVVQIFGISMAEHIMYELIFVLSILSTLFSIIALLISLKKRSNSSDVSYEKDDCVPKENYKCLVKSFENKILEIKSRIVKVEEQIKFPQNSNLNSGNQQTSFDSNVNNGEANNSQEQEQSHLSQRKDTKTKGNEPSEIKIYKWLKVVDGGKLALVESADSAYYRAWTNKNGIIYFEFYCSSSRKGKAINNRTSLIEPFCEIQKGSVEPDLAKEIVVKKQGVLNNDYSVNSKVKIQYN